MKGMNNDPVNSGKSCYHGGAFFDAVGNEFDNLNNFSNIINADVLDAWFPPAPGVINSLKNHIEWIIRTSPPTNCRGLIKTISLVRNIPVECILPGAGSSDLMFRVLPYLVNTNSKVLIIDPSYGEYAHILENVIKCNVHRFEVYYEDDYIINTEELLKQLKNNYDLFVLVNPNSPTGQYLDKKDLVRIIDNTPENTKIWIDETYIEYAGTNCSMEKKAASGKNIIVCKSMSKVYALSGLRTAYLCSSAGFINELKQYTPPWLISLPGQIGAVEALKSPEYYSKCYAETHENSAILCNDLGKLNIGNILPGINNSILIHLDKSICTAAEMTEKCRKHGLFIRDVKLMGKNIGDYTVRIAVKDREINKKIIEIIKEVIL